MLWDKVKGCWEYVVPVVVIGLGVPGVVMAQTSTVNLDDVSLDTASVLALAAIILAAIGAIWGIKKLIKLANRS